MAKVPPFSQIEVTSDNDIRFLYALDFDGRVWLKIGGAAWARVSEYTPDNQEGLQ